MGRVMMGLEKYPLRSLKDLFDYTDASQRDDMFIHVLAFPDDCYTDFTNSFNTKTLFNIKQKVRLFLFLLFSLFCFLLFRICLPLLLLSTSVALGGSMS